MQGLELSTVGLVIYFGLLMFWSALLSYLIVFGLAPSLQKETRRAGSHKTDGSHGGSAHGGHEPPIEPTRAKPFRGFSPYEGFKSFAQGEMVTVEDIVKGLARESMATAGQGAYIAPKVSRSDSGSPNMANVYAFLSALIAQDRETAFDLLRASEENGEGAESFLHRAQSAVESALNARLHGSACDSSLIEILASCETPALQKLMNALSVSEGAAGTKLAITRALNALKD